MAIFKKLAIWLDTPKDTKEYNIWNEETLLEQLSSYGHRKMPIVSDPYKMDLSLGRIDFYEYDNKSGFAVDYDLPLYGEWNDLIVQFSFIKYIGNLYFVFLLDVHVLWNRGKYRLSRSPLIYKINDFRNNYQLILVQI